MGIGGNERISKYNFSKRNVVLFSALALTLVFSVSSILLQPSFQQTTEDVKVPVTLKSAGKYFNDWVTYPTTGLDKVTVVSDVASPPNLGTGINRVSNAKYQDFTLNGVTIPAGAQNIRVLVEVTAKTISGTSGLNIMSITGTKNANLNFGNVIPFSSTDFEIKSRVFDKNPVTGLNWAPSDFSSSPWSKNGKVIAFAVNHQTQQNSDRIQVGHFQVSILFPDTIQPVFGDMPVVPPVEVTSPAGAVVTYTKPTATDNVDPNPTVDCVLPSGSIFPYTPNLSRQTLTPVICTATDFSGNSATASFDVTTQDTTAPDITQDTIAVQNWLLGNPYNIANDDTSTISNNDIFDGTISVQCASTDSNKCITKSTDYSSGVSDWGTYSKTFKVTDSSGNFASKTFPDTLNVVDYGFVEFLDKYAATDAVNLFVNDKLATSPAVTLASTLTGASRTTTQFDNPNPGEFVTNTPINLIVLEDGQTAAPDQLSIKGDDTLTASYLTFNTKTKGVSPVGVAPSAFPGTADDFSSKIRFRESDIYVLGNSATLQINDPAGGPGPIAFNVVSSLGSVPMSATSIGGGRYETTNYVRFIDTAPQNTNDLRVPVGGGPVSATYGGFTATANVILSSNTLQSALINNPTILPDTTIKRNCAGLDADLDFTCNAEEDQATGNGLRIPTGHPANPTYTLSCNPNAVYSGATVGQVNDPLGCTVCPSRTIDDAWVEIDYMKGHRPSEIALGQVASKFLSKNIRPHLCIDQEVSHQEFIAWADPFNTIPEPTVQDVKQDFFGFASELAITDPIRKQNLLDGKRQVFKWALFTHKQVGTDSTGLAEIPGNDFEISLGAATGKVGSICQQARTFMHEWGHTFGRFHGGSDDVNFKPNYPSIMNYLYLWDTSCGGIASNPVDFSPFAFTAINEAQVRESLIIDDGLGTTNLRTLTFGYPATGTPSGIKTYTTGNVLGTLNPPDTDTLDQFSTTVRNFPTLSSPAPGAARTLTSYNDWTSLNWDMISTDGFGNGMITLRNPDNIEPSIVGELDPKTVEFVSTIDDTTTDEGESTDRNIVIDDEHGTTYSIDIDNGDGTQTTVPNISDTTTTTAIDHTYDDICTTNCNGDGSYRVSLDITNNACDSFGTCGQSPTFTAKANVLNIVPVVTINSGSSIIEGELFTTTGFFTSYDGDTVTLTVDYGDGTGPSNLGYASDKTFTLSHPYADAGTYTIIVYAADGDEGKFNPPLSPVSQTTTVTVNPLIDRVVFQAPLDFSGTNIGRTFPVKYTLEEDGAIYKSGQVTKIYLAIQPPNSVIGSEFPAPGGSGNTATYDPISGQYQFQLKTGPIPDLNVGDTLYIIVKSDDNSIRINNIVHVVME